MSATREELENRVQALENRLMKRKNVMSLADLMRAAAEFGVEIVICEMSMDLMGIRREEIIDFPNISVAGVAKFLEQAGSSKVTLFI